MKKIIISLLFLCSSAYATNNIVPSTAHTISLGTSLKPFATTYSDTFVGDGSQLTNVSVVTSLSGTTNYYNINISTPVSSDVHYESYPSTLTLSRIWAECRVAPATSNITITVSSTTAMPSSIGTLTISASGTQSNIITPNVVIPMDTDLIYTVTGTGTSPDLGFNISIKHWVIRQ